MGMTLLFAILTKNASFRSYAPINVSPHPPLQGEVRQRRGFDLIRIQLPHPPGKIQIQIRSSYTGSDKGFDGHVYEWHEPVLLNRYKRERNRRVRRRECRPRYCYLVIADGDKKISSPYVFIK